MKFIYADYAINWTFGFQDPASEWMYGIIELHDKIGNTGVTYKPLNKVIINYFDSNAENLAQKINRCMAMEYNNPDKKAYIYIISSNEEVELKWLSRALEFFDKNKIKYI